MKFCTRIINKKRGVRKCNSDFKLYQENLEDKKIEHNLKEEEQTGNQRQVKGDDAERNIETNR